MITVDSNAGEDGVYDALRARLSDVTALTRARLDVGDVLIRDAGRVICVERKTWADLAASICDGRLQEQKSRMIESEGTRFAYAIEGPLVSWGGSLRGMTHKCMLAALTKLSLRDGFAVFHTASTEDTAHLCTYLLSQLAKDGFRPGGGTKCVAGLSKRKRENLADPTALLRAMLTLVPGMGSPKAYALVDAWPSVGALSAATVEELAATPCAGRRLGPKFV